MSDLKESLRARIDELKVFRTGSFTLASGAQSNFYIDGRLLTLDSVGAELISKIILSNLTKEVDSIGGPATASIPIISSTIAISSILFGRSLKGFYIRPSVKEHGLANVIEGSVGEESKVEIVDDTVTSGNSIISSIKEVEKVGCKVLQTISVFDRNEGGVEKLESEGYNNYSIFKYDHKENKLI